MFAINFKYRKYLVFSLYFCQQLKIRKFCQHFRQICHVLHFSPSRLQASRVIEKLGPQTLKGPLHQYREVAHLLKTEEGKNFVTVSFITAVISIYNNSSLSPPSTS